MSQQSDRIKVKILGNADWENSFKAPASSAGDQQQLKLLVWTANLGTAIDVAISSPNYDWTFAAGDISSDQIVGQRHRRIIVKTHPTRRQNPNAPASLTTLADEMLTVTITNSPSGGTDTATDQIPIQVVDEAFLMYLMTLGAAAPTSPALCGDEEESGSSSMP